MLESIRKGQRWLTLLLVTFVGGVFVFFMGVGNQFGPGRPTGNAVVELGDVRMQISDYQRIRTSQEELYREQLGDQYDARATQAFLDAQSLRQLVDSVVMARSAQDVGMQVSLEEVQDLIRQSPAFRDDSGRFVPEAFVDYAVYEYGSQRNFLESMRTDLLRQKMVALIFDQATVSDAELREAALYGLEKVRIAYVALDTTDLPTDEVVDDETVAAYLAAHRDELQAIYDARQAEFAVPERAHARHILIQVGPEADEQQVEAARQKAEAARARVTGGESFEVVAGEVSEDPGSRDRGGDLGEFERGTHAQVLEDTAFSLEPGAISDVVRTEFGFHVIELESIEPGRTRPFDGDVGPELAREEVLRKRGDEHARQISMQLADAVSGGASLEEAARGLELTLQRTPLFTRRPDGYISGLGGAPEVMATAFALDLDAPSSPTVHTVGTKLVLVQLLERQAPESQELAAAEAQIESSLLASKRNRMVQDWIERERASLEESGDLKINASLVISDS